MALIIPWQGKWPKIADDAFIAPNATIIGDVEIGPGASIWFNCVLRADVAIMRIGARTNIQDGSIIHVDSGGFNTIIGDDVLVGHKAMIHGSTLESGSFVGMCATLLNGTNRMQLFVFGSPQSGQARLAALLDNLGKGASGAAMQNMNIMLGLHEAAGLE